MHTERHPLAGKTVKLNKNAKNLPGTTTEPIVPGAEYRIEDWQDKTFGKSWMDCEGNPAALMYAMRSGSTGLPLDNEVVYGKIGSYGHMIHVSELGEVVE